MDLIEIDKMNNINLNLNENTKENTATSQFQYTGISQSMPKVTSPLQIKFENQKQQILT